MRLALGLLLGAVFFASLYYVTLSESGTTCEVCHTYGGRAECATVAAPDRDQAVQQALSTICAILSDGVTDGMECTRTQPRNVSCSE